MGKAASTDPALLRDREDLDEPVEQAGAVPFRINADGSLELLLITNAQGKWIVPKGGIDPGNTPRQTAHIECMEEAGVRGVLLPGELGHFTYHKSDADHRVTLFALRVTEVLPSYPESKRRKRAWITKDEAAKRVPFPDLAKIIAKLKIA